MHHPMFQFKRIILCLSFIVLLQGVTPYAAAKSQTTTALLKEWHEAPTIPYLSEEEKQDAFKQFELSDSVFVAKIEDIVVSHMGMGAAQVPVTRVNVSDSDVYYGAEMTQDTYLYQKSPKILERLNRTKVIMLVKRSDRPGKTIYVTHVYPADKHRLNWLLEFLGGPEACGVNIEEAC